MKNVLTGFAIPLLTTILISCSGAQREPASPIETFKTYTKAIKQKDVETMKLLLSEATMKMNELEAQARGVSVDEVVRNETLFSETQKTVRWKNEKINGDLATLEVENAMGMWETVPFVLENGAWKIDKKGFAQRLMEEANKSSQELDNLIDQSRQQPQQ
ncbi:MAG TPA: DUF4878 domain-containing protein [Pyrinomonadaceae bacterium]|nr:DUF4878 domain-containing protein [Pyrinomonadaceae bacterium]